MNKIIFFGDSIFFGHGVSVCHNFIYKIAMNFYFYVDTNVIVTTCSHNGDTTRMALDRISFDIQPHWFDIMVMQFGINDGNYWISDQRLPRLSKESFKANLSELIDRAYQRKVKKIFICTNHPMGRIEKFPNMEISLQESSTEYNKLIRQVCEEKRVNLIDIESKFPINIKKYLLDDLTHLNEEGHDIYFKLIYPRLKLCVA